MVNHYTFSAQNIRLVALYLGEGNGTPLQYSCLENPMDGGAWKAAVHGVAEGWTQLGDFTFTFHFHALETEMATHSSLTAQRIPDGGTWWAAHLWGRTESDTTEVTQQQQQSYICYHFIDTKEINMEDAEFWFCF